DTEREVDCEKNKKVKRVHRAPTLNTSLVLPELNYKYRPLHQVSSNNVVNIPLEDAVSSASLNVSASFKE
ncbi:hypothetical protein MKW92_000723, partial [Papaver armeniacum]